MPTFSEPTAEVVLPPAEFNEWLSRPDPRPLPSKLSHALAYDAVIDWPFKVAAA